VVEQALNAVRALLTDLLGQRPPILLLQRREQPGQVVQRPLTRLRPAETVGEPGMEPSYPLGPRLDLLNRQLISTQSHQHTKSMIVTHMRLQY